MNMKKTLCSSLALLLLFLLMEPVSTIWANPHQVSGHQSYDESSEYPAPQDREPKALFIIVDGISADILEMIHTPNLDRIAREGSYTRAWLGGEAGGYSESPTVSAVGYNHLLTGVWSNKHNVYDNEIENPNYNYWNLFRLFKEQRPEDSVAVYSSWLDNRTKLIGDGLPEAGGIQVDIHYDGYEQDTLRFPHEGAYVQDIDELVSEKAAKSLIEDGPYLSWVYLWFPDSAGHAFGEGEEQFEAIRVADRQVGRIWDAVQHRQQKFEEDWLVIVTTDHGRQLPDGSGHGGQTERERTIWMVTNMQERNRYFDAMDPAIVDIYPTISHHLGLEIPRDLDFELDGVPMNREISISDPLLEWDDQNRQLTIQWNSWQDEGYLRIKAATTNKFSEGGRDDYQLLGEFPLIDRSATVELGDLPSDFYKIVLDAPKNSVNRWLILK